jgi:hypothetical protein
LCAFWNGEINCSSVVVPLKFHAKEGVSLPVCGHIVFFLEDGEEMVGMFLSCVFYFKVVNNQQEGNEARFVSEQTMGIVSWVVTMVG